MTTKTTIPCSILAFAFGAALAAAGCHAAGPMLGKQAATLLARTPARPAAGPINPGTPIQKIVTPDGFPLPVSSSRIHVLELGDKPVLGEVVGTASVPLNETFVYFTDGEERFYVARSSANADTAHLVAVRTDADGHFETPAVFPANTPVIANALLARNRRLEGFGLPGGDRVRVSPGSTYVVEFLRDQLAFRSQGIGDYLGRSDVQRALMEQSIRADDLIRVGRLATPSEGPDGDLVIGNGAALAARYTAQAFGEDEASFRAWKVLFPGLYALTTIAGDFNLRDEEPAQPVRSVEAGLHGPVAVAAVPDEPAVYIAERDGWHIKKANQEGFLSLVAGFLNNLDPTVEDATVSADGTPVDDPGLKLANVHEIKTDAEGNLALTFRAGASRLHMVAFIPLQAGTYFGRNMAARTLYYLTARDGKEGYVDGPGESARFRDPQGVVFDDEGNLYVCDRRHNRIRFISRQTGEVSTVLGDGWPFLTPPATGGSSWNDPDDALGGAETETWVQVGGTNATRSVTDFGRHQDVPDSAEGSGLVASFNRPLQLAWRRLTDGSQELFVYDSYNNCIRKAVAPPGKTFKDAAVMTLAGQTTEFTGNRDYTVVIGEFGPIADGPGNAARFNLARYDPTTRVGAQVVNGGLALDAGRNLLFVTDTNNQAIRMIDLGTNKVSTVAKNGPLIEGDAGRALLSANLGGLTILGDGSVAIADNANHVVRRLHLQFGP